MALVLALLAPLAKGQSFAPPVELTAVVQSPRTLAWADLDQDGDQDILFGADGLNSIGWFENLGGMQFSQPHIVEELLWQPATIRAADLDADGKLDILSSTPSGIIWFKNLGSAGFGPVQIVTPSSGPSALGLDVADVDGDGDLDVLSTWTSFSSEDQAGWTEALGGGQFGAFHPTIIPVGAHGIDYPSSIQAADIDGDGDLDALVSFLVGQQTVWVENLGGGSFGTEHLVGLHLGQSKSARAEDYDGDGDLDIITGDGTNLVIYHNLGGAIFAPVQAVGVGADVLSLEVLDLDGDGDSDFLVGSSASVRWIETLAPGSFAAPQVLSNAVIFTQAVAATDLDGDGDPDPISGSHTDDKIATYENLGAGVFGPQSELTSKADGFWSLAIGDLDQDGDLDVLSASRNDSMIAAYDNLGGADFASQALLETTPSDLYSVRAVDLDGDSLLDLLFAAKASDTVGWYKGLGAGGYAALRVIEGGLARPRVVLTDDTDGDGDADIFVGLGLGKAVVWIENLGNGNFAAATQVAATASKVTELHVADLDGDGDRELLFTTDGASSDEVLWCENQGAGQFGPSQLLWSGIGGVVSAALSDLDADGLVDVVVSIQLNSEVLWFENLGGASFAPKSLALAVPAFFPPSEIEVADLDTDGKPDLIVARKDDIFIHDGLGDGRFSADPTGALVSYLTLPRALEAADLDGDGDLDVVFGSANLGRVLWSENLSFPDCNTNGIHDALDVASGTSADCNGNGVPDECDLQVAELDIDGDGQLDACSPPPLMADHYTLSLLAGGTQTFNLSAPFPGSAYLLLGSLSGTSPGLFVAGLTLPLNPDAYFTFTLVTPNTAPLGGSLGLLQATPAGGEASATFDLPSASSPTLVGITASHAYVVFNATSGQVAFISNPVPLTLLP